MDTHSKLAALYLYLHRIRRRVERDIIPYTDKALAESYSDQQFAPCPNRKNKAVAGAVP